MTLQPRLEFEGLQQPSLREEAVALRLQGKTYAEIKEALGIRSNGTLTEWFRDLEGVRRRTVLSGVARDEAKALAIAMRLEGRSYAEITAATGVKRGTLSVWLRDVLISEDDRTQLRRNSTANLSRRSESNRLRRIAKTERIMAEAAAEIGPLTARDVFLLGVVAYWCEGGKQKEWNPSNRVQFINQDPRLIRLFVAFVECLGYRRSELDFRVYIHETADVSAAETWWAAQVGIPVESLRKTSLKRHNPKTVRHIPDAYFGCLAVSVPASTDLNRRIAGWYQGIANVLDTLGVARSGVV